MNPGTDEALWKIGPRPSISRADWEHDFRNNGDRSAESNGRPTGG